MCGEKCTELCGLQRGYGGNGFPYIEVESDPRKEAYQKWTVYIYYIKDAHTFQLADFVEIRFRVYGLIGEAVYLRKLNHDHETTKL